MNEWPRPGDPRPGDRRPLRVGLLAIGALFVVLVAVLAVGIALEASVRSIALHPVPTGASPLPSDVPWLTAAELGTAFGSDSWGGEALRLIRVGPVNLPTGRVVAGDPFYAPGAAPFSDQLPPGSHPVEVLVTRQGAFDTVVAARLLVDGASIATWRPAHVVGQAPTSAEEPSGYGVDSGTGSFTSAEAAALIEHGYERYADDLLRALQAASPRSWIRMPLDAAGPAAVGLDIVAFPSGFGDGAFPTWVGFDRAGRAVAFMTDFGVLTPAT
jgi:hypothetical protein